ncbi:hypothetical protein CYLTODRAFT_421278 [Cylindrobasidium torrendii FP15055 ss-10]|uniref:UbiA prenyltransferase n=1 Tax=Cylindrobasidium torrendii FP15055 ss-10 TaxID=1314674 RepID=A0A0D7BE65_9AGAR|nr:hypothetical protein CYLTODRAFT_421278 [Cylindrobasidium torrendii FP15055 ss-10]
MTDTKSAMPVPTSTSYKSFDQILYTLYLFTKSDFKTIMFPVTTFAMSLAEKTTWSRVPLVAMWVWFELLGFNTANQTAGASPDEDAINKPWRPVPAKRITLENAKTLRHVLSCFNMCMAIVLHTVNATVGFEILTTLHNDLHTSEHWFTKNAGTALLYCFMEFGATLVADGSSTLTLNQTCGIIGSVIIICTTIHAQDFCDVDGDRASGRSTFPIAYPETSRITMLTLPFLWSLVICLFSTAHVGVLAALVASSVWISYRFYLIRNLEADKASYLYYNIWLCLVHVSLGFVNVDAGLARIPAVLDATKRIMGMQF